MQWAPHSGIHMKTGAWIYTAILAASLAVRPASALELVVPGTGDGMEMLKEIGAAYNAETPNVTVTIPPSTGSGGAIAAVGAERDALGRVARPLTEKERAQGLTTVPIVRIPSAFFVHPSAGVTKLTFQQLADIYAGNTQNWQELGGADLRVRVVRREEADSTLAVLRAKMPGWKTLEITPRSKLATTTQEAVETVKEVQGAIGFGPYSRSLEAGATVLKIEGKHPLDEGYPSAVTLELVYKEGRLPPEAAAFLNFARSRKAHTLMSNWGGVPVLD